MKRRLLSILCALALCLALLPATALAADPEGVWTDYAADSFAGGDGTENDPYQIASAEQLAKLSKDVSEGTSYQGSYFILTANIDLGAHRWVPIGLYQWLSSGGTINKSFQGFLDGNDKTINGMFVDEEGGGYCGGFFGKIAVVTNGSPVGVKDLTITGATVRVDESGLNECSGAILAGNVMGADTQLVVFENITVSGSVAVTSTNGYNNIGGMLGYASWVKATNCHAENIEVSGGSNSGGFVGNDSGSVFENCTATGTVSGSWALGGFVGYSTSAVYQNPAGKSTYTKCAADVNVEGNNWRVGGFVGYAEYGEFKNCVAYGDVESSVTDWDPGVGGFMGESATSMVTYCHAAGVVTSASSANEAGGFMGTYTGGSFSNCSFDSEKNPNLNAAGEGTLTASVTGETSAVVLANICEDYYGGHQYGEWITETEATCTTEGSKYQICERCGAKDNFTVIQPLGHKLSKTDAKEPTCTEAGNIAYWTCETCGKIFEDENGAEEITLEQTVREATGHNYVNGTCTVCGAAQPSSGSSSSTTTETTKNPDGSTTTTVTNKVTGTVTETTKNPDGSQEVVETKKDGTVTTTTTDTEGNKTQVVENPDGSGKTTITNKDGSSSATTVDETGKTESEVKLPAAVVEEAQGETVALPMPAIPVTTDKENAPTVTVDLPGGTSAKVEIPVEDVTPGTVAILVKDDGTEEVLKTSVPTDNGVVVTLNDGDTVKLVDNSKDFADVADGYWAAEAVDFAVSRELFSGTGANTFSPNTAMTRGMFVTVLARLEGVDTSTGDTWYAAGRQWAMENGISDGTNLDQPLTREQLATMLYRYAGSPAVSGSLSGYTDAASISAWASDAMTWAVENGLVNGVGGSSLAPQGTATRAQVAAILMRFIQLG